MAPQEIFDEYLGYLFGHKYMNEIQIKMVKFENQLDLSNYESVGHFRRMVMEKNELCWVQNERALKWDEDPELKIVLNSCGTKE